MVTMMNSNQYQPIRKTKIICTLGPATENIIEQLIQNGMDTARVNQSHETHEIHARRIQELKQAREKLGKPVALLMDTKGPEIRTGLVEKPVQLRPDQSFDLVCKDLIGDEHQVSVSYPGLCLRVSASDIIIIDDGNIRLQVEQVSGDVIHCRVLTGGVLSNRKSVNVPDCDLGLPFLSEKDLDDIQFAVKHDFDFIALSFVSYSYDIEQVREILNRFDCSSIRIIAKIENKKSVEQIDSIIEASDGIMIARGDLGVELPLEQVPIIQKRLIKACYLRGKPVITATQMLESMIDNPLPTRAEVSDVANAVYDSTSAVMLSGETAAGQYPVDTVRIMTNIILSTEQDIDYKNRFSNEDWFSVKNTVNIIGQATTVAAFELDAKAIIVITNTGNSARMIARFRPVCPIIAITVDPRSERQLNMSWGIHPHRTQYIAEAKGLLNNAVECAKMTGLVQDGDVVILTSGLPTGEAGKTNMLKVHRIGDKVL